MRSMLRLAALFLALLAVPAFASGDTMPAHQTQAHPSMWTVHGPHGTVYLFGSVHFLSPLINWHTREIDHAMARADEFVFEVPNDDLAQATIKTFIQEHGTLPQGSSLRALLSRSARTDYDADLQSVHLPLAAVDNKRPWLAGLLLDVTRLMQANYSPDSGVDSAVLKIAHENGKSLSYLETIDQQLDLIAPDSDTLELQEFEISLKEFRNGKDTLDELVRAWSRGDAATLDVLTNSDLASHPEAKKALLDDRNRAWIPKIEAMLSQDKVFFVTVGAGHLVGAEGVPALLRAAGYRVDGP